MSIIDRLPYIAAEARGMWERGTIPASLWFDAVMDRYDGVRAGGPSAPGRIITGDNLRVTKTMFAAVSAGTHDAPTLIYMDPPFFTNAKYSSKAEITAAGRGGVSLSVGAFSDVWKPGGEGESKNGGTGGASSGKGRADPERGSAAAKREAAFERYLTMLSLRIIASRELLAADGSLWIHLDHHAAHYVKVLADHIFGGPKHLLNEVIWHYSSGGATKKHFARKHDTLLFYAKDPGRHRFYPMKEKSYNRDRKPYRFRGVKEYRDDEGWYTLVNMKDVWKINMVGRTSGERTGYATQKPEALIERIVSSCTESGDLCVDMFGGSGTLAAVCEKTGRRWITIDENPLASLHAERRMAGLGAVFEALDGSNSVAEDPDWHVGAPWESRPGRRFMWELCAKADETHGDGAALVTIRPVSYSPPEAVLRGNPEQAAELVAAGRESPEGFMAGMSAEVCPEAGGGHPGEDCSLGDPFRPQAVVYGADCLNMLVGGADSVSLKVRVSDIFGGSEIQYVTVTPESVAQGGSG
jgi:hypothetical protein